MNCGLSMEPVGLNYPRPSYRCAHCGTYNFREAKLCATCGHGLRPSAWKTAVAVLIALFIVVPAAPVGALGCCAVAFGGGSGWTMLAIVVGVCLLIGGGILAMTKLLKP